LRSVSGIIALGVAAILFFSIPSIEVTASRKISLLEYLWIEGHQSDSVAQSEKVQPDSRGNKSGSQLAYIKQYENKQPPCLAAWPRAAHLNNNPDAKYVSFAALKSFILEDRTSEINYYEELFHCVDFAEQVHNNAERAGIKSALVLIGFEDNEIGHALNAFKTTDRGLVYIDCTGMNPEDSFYFSISGDKNKPRRDLVAYVEKGKRYGCISIDNAESLDYSFFVQHTHDCQKLAATIADFNKQVDAFNRALGGRTSLREPEYSRFKAWEATLEAKKQMILESKGKLDNCFKPLGIVETVEIYW